MRGLSKINSLLSRGFKAYARVWFKVEVLSRGDLDTYM